MVQRHRFISAIRYPDPQEVVLLPLDRPVTLVDVLKRHPEWRRRLELTLLARRDGEEPPEFPMLHYCKRCDADFTPSRQSKTLCPDCRYSKLRAYEERMARKREHERNRSLKRQREIERDPKAKGKGLAEQRGGNDILDSPRAQRGLVCEKSREV